MQYITSLRSILKLKRLTCMSWSRNPLLPKHRRHSRIVTLLALYIAAHTLVGCQSDAIVDTQAPSEPRGLAVTVLSMTQIRISWQASTDDVAVTSYRVLRNGDYIGVTNSTVFLDDTTNANTPRRYEVIAVDAANNISLASHPVLGERFQSANIPRLD